MGFAGLHLKIVDLHVSLLHLVLDVKLFTKNIARSLVELLAEVGQVILAHGANVREGSNLLQHSFRHTHLGVCDRTDCPKDETPATQGQDIFCPCFLV